MCATRVGADATSLDAGKLDFKHLRLTSQTVPKALRIPALHCAVETNQDHGILFVGNQKGELSLL